MSPRLSTLHFGSLSQRSRLSPPALLDFLFLVSLTISRPSSCTSVPHLARASTASAAVFPSALPAEFVVVVVVDVIISVEAPCVAAGFLRTPALTLPLYQETPRAQQPRRKETDRPPSSDPCSLRPLSSKERERKMEDQRRWYGTRKEGAIESATRIN